MIICDVICRHKEAFTELSATVIPAGVNGGGFAVWFRLPSDCGPVPIWGDPFLVGFLIPCMYTGESIRVVAPVSRKLLAAIPTIQRQFLSWYPDLTKIDIAADDTHSGYRSDRPVTRGAFFSAGVDSLYTLIKHHQDIDYLLLIHGFENPLRASRRLAATLDLVKAYGKAYNKKWLTVYTNLRAMADQNLAPWGRRSKKIFFGDYYMGSMLAAVGLSMQNRFQEIFIAASHRHDAQVPYSSHRLVDFLWSTENLTFHHDGCEASRLEKIREIGTQHPETLGNLQVCESNLDGEINCCCCDKCLRTMLGLELYGLLDRCGTFPLPLSYKKIVRLANLKRWRRDYEELLDLAQQNKRDDAARSLGKLLSNRFSGARIVNYCRTVLTDARRYLALAANLSPVRKRTRVWHDDHASY